MSKVQSYLSGRFKDSHWPYHGVNTLFYDLLDKATKEELKEEIRKLKSEGFIDIVEGRNEYLIKIIDETKF